MNRYIQSVLEANSLFDDAEWLGGGSGKLCIHIDRHVELPPPDETCDVVQATCRAGIRLPMQWRQDREQLMRSGLRISEPVLVIDDEWMTQLADAPPPHVCITIAKDANAFAPPRFADHGGDDFELFPLRGLLEEEAGRRRVVRVRADPNPPYDEIGFWLVM